MREEQCWVLGNKWNAMSRVCAPAALHWSGVCQLFLADGGQSEGWVSPPSPPPHPTVQGPSSTQLACTGLHPCTDITLLSRASTPPPACLAQPLASRSLSLTHDDQWTHVSLHQVTDVQIPSPLYGFIWMPYRLLKLSQHKISSSSSL